MVLVRNLGHVGWVRHSIWPDMHGQATEFNTDGHRCIISALVSVLTKAQGGAIFPREFTKLQKLKKIENNNNRV